MRENEPKLNHDPDVVAEQIRMLEAEIKRKPEEAKAYESTLKELKDHLASLKTQEGKREIKEL